VLALVAAVSGIYDVLLGLALLLWRDALAHLLGAPVPVSSIQSDLNGLFLVSVGLGYVLPFRDPDRYRGYLWIMGPLLKGAGAILFVIDRVARHSPAAFLTFAGTDGFLALLTLAALLARPRRPAAASAGRAESRPA
jgi:hypothetical protein